MQRLLIFIAAVLLFPALLAAQPQPFQAREAEIRAAVEGYILQKTAGLGCEIRIKRFSISDASALPEGDLQYEIVAPQQWEGWGNSSFAVIVRKGERVVRNIPGRVEVEALAEMVIAVRQIDHGTVVGAGDVALKKMEISATQGRYLASITDAVGKKSRATFRSGSPLKSDQLEKAALVKSGQIVTIVAENERMRVTVPGKARSAGGEGDTISVQNMNSLKEFPARIVDATTVSVAF